MSRPVEITISHQLGREEAKNRIRNGFGQIQAQLSSYASAVHHQWVDDRLEFGATALGQQVRGTIDVLEDIVRIQLLLPGPLGWLARKITGRIQHQADLMLEKK